MLSQHRIDNVATIPNQHPIPLLVKWLSNLLVNVTLFGLVMLYTIISMPLKYRYCALSSKYFGPRGSSPHTLHTHAQTHKRTNWLYPWFPLQHMRDFPVATPSRQGYMHDALEIPPEVSDLSAHRYALRPLQALFSCSIRKRGSVVDHQPGPAESTLT
jgi:hypothetical protein